MCAINYDKKYQQATKYENTKLPQDKYGSFVFQYLETPVFQWHELKLFFKCGCKFPMVGTANLLSNLRSGHSGFNKRLSGVGSVILGNRCLISNS
ncbi:hypothetical protein DS742_28045 [Lacrimispora amygdalina]|uniref:Uncharacterized protein n=1 Tax=Lacrimispora amygdalina TaxID=253257 RepID=A0A3E2N3M9_9FIRM|nr:hypothetical protein DS742_28045 [Clostridium indicum]